MVSFEALKDSYDRSWANLKIRPARADEVGKEANRLLKGKNTYQQIETKTGVPWWFVGLCHYRESHFNFKTYLGNGQALDQITTIVPKGRVHSLATMHSWMAPSMRLDWRASRRD